MGLASLQIQDSNNADVQLDTGLNLFNILANMCSTLCYEVLPYCESIEVDSYVKDLNSKILSFSLSA